MQTTVKISTYEDALKVMESTRTSAHPDIRVGSFECIYGGQGGVDSPHNYILSGHAVLDITSVPPALLKIEDDGSVTLETYGVTLSGHDLSEINIGTYGKIMAERKITSMDVVTGPPALLVFNLDDADSLGMARLVGSEVGGYFNVNDEYLYFIFGNYSEQKVYIEDCGTLDENGDRYEYDPEDGNMIETDTVHVKASATLTSDGELPVAGDTVTIDDQEYMFVDTFTTPSAPNEIMIGITPAEAFANLVHAINGTGSDLVNYSIGTSDCPSVVAIMSLGAGPYAFDVVAREGGVEGNDINIGCTYDGEAEHQSWGDGNTLTGGSTTTYGRYERYTGTVVAAALQRCINTMFPQQVVTVTYEEERFVITSVLADIQNMAIISDAYSLSSLLGFDNAEFEGTIDRLSELKVYASGYGVNDIYSAADGQIVIAAANNGNIPRKLYFLDITAPIQVHILDV